MGILSWLRRSRPKAVPMRCLQTERLVLRGFRESDALDVFAYAQNPAVGRMAGFPPHKNIDDSRLVVQRFMESGNVWAIVEKRTGRVIGSIGLHPSRLRDVRGARELGYSLGEKNWGQGFATEAAARVLRHAFVDLHCPVVDVRHFTQNPKSKRVIRKLGFTYEGTLRMAALLDNGEYRDELCYSLTREEYLANKA